MEKTYQTLIEKIQIDNGYFNIDTVSEEELKKIQTLKGKAKKEYLSAQEIIINQDNLSVDFGKCYRIITLGLTDEQLMRLIIMRQGKTLESINLKLTILVVVFVSIIIIGFIVSAISS